MLKDHANQEAIPGCLYADEAVVGNVLAPDNRRRSWCFYFCCMSILPMRKDTLWLPISVIRSDIIEQLPGGLPQALSIVMRQCQQFLSDGIIVDGQIVITHPLHLLADEDGLKKWVHTKVLLHCALAFDVPTVYPKEMKWMDSTA